jgi:hypothetical protein
MSPSIDSRENREAAGEIKFVVAPEIGARVREWARERLVPDPNAAGCSGDEYHITSIYFDTAEFDVFQRRGSFGRSKFRIRRYGASDHVFLERKLKTGGLVSKRRSLVPAEQIAWLGNGAGRNEWNGRWYDRRLKLRGLQPICQIGYDRTARVQMTSSGPVRLTIDQSVSAQPVEGIEFQESEGTPVAPDRWIVELKFRGEAPVLFKGLIQEFSLAPMPISKYRLAVSRLGLAPAEILDNAPVPSPAAAYA